LITVDLRFNNGLAVAQKAGQVNHFDAATKQDQRRLVGINWMTAERFAFPGSIIFQEGWSVTLTLRKMNGDYLCKDLPIARLCLDPQGAGYPLRNLVFEPAYIDWRRSFVRQVLLINNARNQVVFSLDYEPRR
jgi:hypothetical protein